MSGSCRRLIINADDFGLDRAISSGILQAHDEGVLTSTSLVAGGEFADEAALAALKRPALGVGIHLSLLDTAPLEGSENVPSLVTAEGRFPPSTSSKIFVDLFMGRLDLAEIEREFEAQIRRVLDLGIAATHLDGHNHIHVFPSLVPLVIRLAKKYKIPAVRYPAEALWALRPFNSVKWAKKTALTLAAGLNKRKWVKAGIRFPDRFRGMGHSGHLTRDRLLALIKALRPGITEIMCHPGEPPAGESKFPWEYEWAQEKDALCDPEVRALLDENKIERVNFSVFRENDEKS